MTDPQDKLRARAAELLCGGQISLLIGWGASRLPEQTRPLFISGPERAGELLFNEYCLLNLGKYAFRCREEAGRVGICARGCESRALQGLLDEGLIQRERLYVLGLTCPGGTTEKCRHCAGRASLFYDELLHGAQEEQPMPADFSEIEALERLSARERSAFWRDVYRRCLRCYACREICPACTCPRCYVENNRENWPGRGHGTGENLLFGATRALHVAGRCRSCGECERVCPAGLPLMKLFRKPQKDLDKGDGPCC